MLSNNRAKYIRSLHYKKFREEYGQFTAEGHKLVSELIRSRYHVSEVFGTLEWIEANRSLVTDKGIPLTGISFQEMERISVLSSPGPVLAIADIPDQPIDRDKLPGSLVLMLDGIRDPGNMGTILRIADWFGIREVICSKDSVDLYNPKVVQATMGSIARVAVHYLDLPAFLEDLPREIKVYGTFLEGQSVYSADLRENGIIVIGNESNGISEEVARLVTDRIFIPSYPQREGAGTGAESLNASVAAAIVCSEFRR